MITSVKKLPNDKYLLNDAVVISNFDFEEEGITYSIDYDENLLTEKEAFDISETFIREAIQNSVENSEKS